MKPIKIAKDKLEEIYLLYEQKMYHLAFSVLKDEGLAEDAVHDAILKIINYLPKIQKTDSFECRSLVMKITKTTTIDLYRSSHKEQISSAELDEELLNTSQNNIDSYIEETAAKFLINRCMKDMPDSLKEIVKLKYYCQLSNQEISQILQVSMDVVRKRDERLKRFIKEMAGENYEI